MSDPRLDALARSARNRGLKLVRSRVRTPGKDGFGKVGLSDQNGSAVFGLDGTAPSATADELEDYLRSLETKDWGASLKTIPGRTPSPSGPTATDTGRRLGRTEPKFASARPQAARERQRAVARRPRPIRRAEPPPPPQIRRAALPDAKRLAELICELGHPINARQVRSNLKALAGTDELPLVAILGERIVGMCGVGKRVVIARPAPIGRITSLIVTKDAQGKGIGRMLVEAAEHWMREKGCGLIELTSNDRRAEAHAFYRHLGFERTSIRFAKSLRQPT